MQIGFVRKKEFVVRDENGERKTQSYLEMSIRAIFGVSAKFTISKNNSESENAPEYNIFAHNEKGWIGRKQKVGALWMKEFEGEKFMSGHIETPFVPGGKLQISLWRAKPLYDGEKVDWLYDVNWKAYNPNRDESEKDAPGYEVSVVQPRQSEIDIDDEILF